MADKQPQGVIVVINSVIRSFSTSQPTALFRLAPWAIPVTATLAEAATRLDELSVGALLAADPATGEVRAVITQDPEIAALGGRKKNRNAIADRFEECFRQCQTACASEGGCGGFAIITTPTAISCDYWCMGTAAGDQPTILDQLWE